MTVQTRITVVPNCTVSHESSVPCEVVFTLCPSIITMTMGIVCDYIVLLDYSLLISFEFINRLLRIL